MEKKFAVGYRYQNQILSAEISLSQVSMGKVILRYIEMTEQLEFIDELVFVSFCNLRNSLEKSGKILLCKGCRIDVHPSGSQLKWIKAYQLKMGIRINPENDKVMIFDKEMDMSKIGSVSEQEIYFNRWLKSIEGISY